MEIKSLREEPGQQVVDPDSTDSDEFMLTAVPDSATISAYRIGVMLVAANITLPVFVLGGRLGAGMGVPATALASIWGGLILAVVAGACGYVGARSRLTTYVLINNAFGRQPGEIVNILLAVSTIGWFAVIVLLFAQTILQIAGGETGRTLLLTSTIGGTIVMVVTTLAGFKRLNFYSNITLPLKMLLLAAAVIAALRQHGIVPPISAVHERLDQTTAISFIVGGWIVGAVTAPDLARFARGPWGGALSSGLGIGVGYPIILVMTSIPAAVTGNTDIIAIMLSLGLGVIALIIILLSAWTSGATNLYSGTLVLSAVFHRSRFFSLTIIGGVIGMVAAITGLADRIFPFLELLSVATPPIGGVYVARFFLDLRRNGVARPPRAWSPAAILASALGIALAGFGDRFGVSLSGITSIDSLVVASVSYLLLDAAESLILKRRLG